MSWSPPAPWQRERFLLGDLSVPGWHRGDTYELGGIAWVCPFFDRQTALRVARFIEANGGVATYVEGEDAWVVTPAPGYPTVRVQGQYRLWPGQRFRLYPLGAGAWIWDKERPRERAEHQGEGPLRQTWQHAGQPNLAAGGVARERAV